MPGLASAIFRRLRFAVRPSATSQNRVVGGRGENIAADYLRRHGHRILFRNFRCDLGEIDLVTRDGGSLVFVEVKTRSSGWVAPEVEVDREKQRRIVRAARVYLSGYRGGEQPPYRFDVVAVVLRPDTPPEVRHHVRAF